MTNAEPAQPNPSNPPLAVASRLVRAAFVIIGLVIWFGTQAMIGKRAFPANGIGDGTLLALAPVHHYLVTHPGAANALLISSSILIDALGVFLLAGSIFGKTVRPFLGLVCVLGMRQVCQMLCALPPPDEMIWRNPGFPSLLVTYGVSNDLFFSGHTATAVLGAIELARTGRRGFAMAGQAIVLFEILAVLSLRAHYTMDVFTGAVAALWVASFTPFLAARCDAWLARIRARPLPNQ